MVTQVVQKIHWKKHFASLLRQPESTKCNEIQARELSEQSLRGSTSSPMVMRSEPKKPVLRAKSFYSIEIKRRAEEAFLELSESQAPPQHPPSNRCDLTCDSTKRAKNKLHTSSSHSSTTSSRRSGPGRCLPVDSSLDASRVKEGLSPTLQSRHASRAPRCHRTAPIRCPASHWPRYLEISSRPPGEGPKHNQRKSSLRLCEEVGRRQIFALQPTASLLPRSLLHPPAGLLETADFRSQSFQLIQNALGHFATHYCGMDEEDEEPGHSLQLGSIAPGFGPHACHRSPSV